MNKREVLDKIRKKYFNETDKDIKEGLAIAFGYILFSTIDTLEYWIEIEKDCLADSYLRNGSSPSWYHKILGMEKGAEIYRMS